MNTRETHININRKSIYQTDIYMLPQEFRQDFCGNIWASPENLRHQIGNIFGNNQELISGIVRGFVRLFRDLGRFWRVMGPFWKILDMLVFWGFGICVLQIIYLFRAHYGPGPMGQGPPPP